MAYDPTKPPSLVTQDVGNRGQAIWTYSTADSAATVDTANYISNADALGMKVGDILKVYNSTAKTTTDHTVISVTKAAGCDLSDGTATAGATNTD